MYQQSTENFGTFKKITLSNQNGMSFSVIPDYGANVIDLEISCRGKSFHIIDGVVDDQELIHDKAYKSSVLAPWPNRTKDGKFTFNGKSYSLPINEIPLNNALHGFIYKKPFVVDETILEPDFAKIKLSHHYRGDDQGFPFKFKTTLIYSISDKDGFQVEVEIENMDHQQIPMGFGWHPYIKLPVKADELSLQLPQCEQFEIDDQMIITGKTKEFNSFSSSQKIGNAQFDSCFKLTSNETVSTTILKDEKSGIDLHFWQERGKSGFDYLQIYIPEARKTIALEPMTCCVDALNNQRGLLELAPGTIFNGKFGIKAL